jgi:hypothetical protein
MNSGVKPPRTEARHEGDVMEHTLFLVGSLRPYTDRGALHILLMLEPTLSLTKAVRGMTKIIYLILKKWYMSGWFCYRLLFINTYFCNSYGVYVCYLYFVMAIVLALVVLISNVKRL